MTTYHDHDGITIYHADNADVEWPDPADVGLLLTDPPYGIDWVPPTGTGDQLRHMPKPSHRQERMPGDVGGFDVSPLLPYRLVAFGANYYLEQLPAGGLIVWDKTGGKIKASFMPGGEVAWTNIVDGVHLFRHLWQGAFRDYSDPEWNLRGLHPTQKPTTLMRWIIDRWTEPGDLIFDPYMGSGPVARACLDLGRRYIGIEIVEEYCQAAVDRLGQLALNLQA